ncbi:ankyrin repeat domain-containing protein, partial [Chlamydiia bacterium]|nr:ankyrin repeat domain-containing protein [Chlamydiia bacterium]
AIRFNDQITLQTLLNKKPCDINETDADGFTPIMYACRANDHTIQINESTIQILLSQPNIDINRLCYIGRHVLSYLLKNKKASVDSLKKILHLLVIRPQTSLEGVDIFQYQIEPFTLAYQLFGEAEANELFRHITSAENIQFMNGIVSTGVDDITPFEISFKTNTTTKTTCTPSLYLLPSLFQACVDQHQLTNKTFKIDGTDFTVSDISTILLDHIAIIENNQSFTGISERSKNSVYTHLQELARNTLSYLIDINETRQATTDTLTHEIIDWLENVSFTTEENDSTFFGRREPISTKIGHIVGYLSEQSESLSPSSQTKITTTLSKMISAFENDVDDAKEDLIRYICLTSQALTDHNDNIESNITTITALIEHQVSFNADHDQFISFVNELVFAFEYCGSKWVSSFQTAYDIATCSILTPGNKLKKYALDYRKYILQYCVEEGVRRAWKIEKRQLIQDGVDEDTIRDIRAERLSNSNDVHYVQYMQDRYHKLLGLHPTHESNLHINAHYENLLKEKYRVYKFSDWSEYMAYFFRMMYTPARLINYIESQSNDEEVEEMFENFKDTLKTEDYARYTKPTTSQDYFSLSDSDDDNDIDLEIANIQAEIAKIPSQEQHKLELRLAARQVLNNVTNIEPRDFENAYFKPVGQSENRNKSPAEFLAKAAKTGDIAQIFSRNSPIQLKSKENKIPLMNATRALWKKSRSPTTVMQVFDQKIDGNILKMNNDKICDIFCVRVGTENDEEQTKLKQAVMHIETINERLSSKDQITRSLLTQLERELLGIVSEYEKELNDDHSRMILKIEYNRAVCRAEDCGNQLYAYEHALMKMKQKTLKKRAIIAMVMEKINLTNPVKPCVETKQSLN